MSVYDFSRAAAVVMNSPYWGDIPDSLNDADAIAERNRRYGLRQSLEDWFLSHPEAESEDELPDDLRTYWDVATLAAEAAQVEADAFMRIFEDVTGEIDAAADAGDIDTESVDVGGVDVEDIEDAAPGEEIFLGTATGENYVPPPARRK